MWDCEYGESNPSAVEVCRGCGAERPSWAAPSPRLLHRGAVPWFIGACVTLLVSGILLMQAERPAAPNRRPGQAPPPPGFVGILGVLLCGAGLGAGAVGYYLFRHGTFGDVGTQGVSLWRAAILFSVVAGGFAVLLLGLNLPGR